jgi:hypothetical protein
MGLAVGILVNAAFALSLAVFVVIDQRKARKRNTMLRLKAEAMQAWPVASLRGGQQIVVDFRHSDPVHTPFMIVDGLESRPVRADEIWRLWQRGRLRWYRSDGVKNDPVGLRHYLLYATPKSQVSGVTLRTSGDPGARVAHADEGKTSLPASLRA